jgi:hypothetical protein
MHRITDADREAANALREILADVSGFWHNGGDESALCRALARHRAEAEERLMEKLTPMIKTAFAKKDGRARAVPRIDSDAAALPDRLAI